MKMNKLNNNQTSKYNLMSKTNSKQNNSEMTINR